jgi:hypothetical protein
MTQDAQSQETENPKEILTRGTADIPIEELLQKKPSVIDKLLEQQAELKPGVAVQDSALRTISIATLQPGTILYDPHNPQFIVEFKEQYTNEEGQQKVRLKLHDRSDDINERYLSLPKEHVKDLFSYLLMGAKGLAKYGIGDQQVAYIREASQANK